MTDVLHEHTEHFDLTGELPTDLTMIEASAGTGKTWTIAALVTRYVAEGAATIDQLLVVTFTRSASQELRERVRARLESTAVALERAADPRDDALIDHLRCDDPTELAARIARLRAALSSFDTATIATIHQFCQVVLHSLGVAGESDPYAQLVEDLTDLRTEVIEDRFVHDRLQGIGRATLKQAAKAADLALDNPRAAIDVDGTPAGVRADAKFAADVREEFERRKQRGGVLSFDDLLSHLADALHDDDSLARMRMRRRWKVVLVDEFQDTDPVQWQVFARAFKDVPGTCVVLIGDPKQAIYGFRGGDVHTYLRAKNHADRTLSLPYNHRSDPALVDALTRLTANVELSPGIVARPVRPARTENRLRLDGTPLPPVRVRAILGQPSGPQARARCGADAADDIVRLLGSGATLKVGGQDVPVGPEHVAVLAQTHFQLHTMRELLRERGVPAVLVSGDSVLRTAAAQWWLQLLTAMEQPHRSPRVRAAALTPMIGVTAAGLDAMGEDGTEKVGRTIRDLISEFHRGGVTAVLDHLRSNGLSARVLSRVGGERDLTDIEHCAQVLQQRIVEGIGGLPGLVVWMMRQSAADVRATPQTRVVRLDSDARAVTLSTVHASKGLQYPVVYTPFLYDHRQRPDDLPVVVQRGEQRALCFDQKEAESDAVQAELLAENMRLAYVAMTRAQSQWVTWWSGTPVNTTTSGLHRLLFGQGTGDSLKARLELHPEDRPQTVPQVTRAAGRNPRADQQDLQLWADSGAFRIEGVPDSVQEPVRHVESVPDDDLSARAFDRVFDSRWRRTSYSALAAAGEDDATLVEPEPEVVGQTDEETITAPPSDAAPDPALDALCPMADQPAGATFGSLAHAVLEEADLQADDLPAELRRHIVELQRFWPAEVEVDSLAASLDLMCRTPLGPIADDVTLRDLPRTVRLAEMEFEVPLAGGDRPHARAAFLRDAAALLRTHLPDDDPIRPYADVLEGPSLGGQELLGYLTGSIDLTFGHDGRYFVVDYKTNRLSAADTAPTLADYAPDRLDAAMNHSSYPLQALLYSVVLHRYLRWRQPGYDPARHLGGVMYLYVRGMAGPDVPRVDGRPCGVFAWTPPTALVEALSDLLDGTPEETA